MQVSVGHGTAMANRPEATAIWFSGEISDMEFPVAI
jgi:hypothetical protein